MHLATLLLSCHLVSELHGLSTKRSGSSPVISLHLRLVFYAADMTFTHEGNKTYFDGLVNFEKMVSIRRVF